MAKSGPHVALIIETSKAFGRGLLKGIGRYVRGHGPWSIYIDERGLTDPVPDWLHSWDGDGIIARVVDRTMSRSILDVGVPVVDVLGQLPDLNLPTVRTDDEAVVRAAVDHLTGLGFRHFAFVTVDGMTLSEERNRAMAEMVAGAGHSFDVYTPLRARKFDEQWEAGQDDLALWIRELPKPVGIMAAQDLRALCILDACRRADVAVPEQVAVIAADNDDVICDLSDPPLTSVPHNLDRIGFEAAAMLDQLMSGEASPAGPKLIAPLQVVRRQSTDIVAISDPDIVAAMRYIREHACDPVEVTDVAREVRLSRRVLERRFSKHLGHSPHAEIVRVRLERVRELLLATDLPLVAVAQKAGFSYAAYLNVAFKKRFGQTPGAFRASVAATNGRN